MTVNVLEAKTRLSELIRLAENGEEIIIARAGKPAAVLSRYTQVHGKRELGFFKGLISMSEDFNESLPEEILDTFYS